VEKVKKNKNIKRKQASPPAVPFNRGLIDRAVSGVKQFAEPLCEAEGMELVHVEFLRESGGRTLRMFIDKPGGVSLDDCARISRQVGDYLDVGMEDIGPYNLEVSSPGPERPLGRISDYDRFKGSRAKISILEAIDGRKNFTGILDGVSGDNIRLQVNDTTIAIPLDAVRRARLTGEEN